LKIRIASLTILCLALAAVPAFAQWSYDNGQINGTTDAWTTDFGYIVSDNFTADGSAAPAGSFSIGTWDFPGDTTTSLDWSITGQENGGASFGSGTATGANLTDKFVSTNQYGYDIHLVTATITSSTLTGGVTYWLNIQNEEDPAGDPIYWDENSGVGCSSKHCPSLASESAVGTIPSEAFTISSGGGTTPEPSSIMLFGSGILGLAGLLRRKLF
jgi:PEP-CTERM motif-containing protein